MQKNQTGINLEVSPQGLHSIVLRRALHTARGEKPTTVLPYREPCKQQ